MNVHCSVIIPTKNAMPGFVRVLEMVLSQRTPWPFEVIVIDSGSRDGTIEHIRRQFGVRLIEIEPAEFGHGRTRNQAIAESNGLFVALLTHDAIPVDTMWLASLVGAVEQDDRIAGAFGRHVANPAHSAFVQRDLDLHFGQFLRHPLVVDRDLDATRYPHDIGWRQFLHFFSDNNACLRRSIWEKHPYPDVDFAEDQVWADTIIAAGFAKAYAPDAVVYHSHAYGVVERLQRSFDEAASYKQRFGYELMRSPWACLRTAAGLTFRDLRFGVERGLLLSEPLTVAKRIGEDWALAAGQLLGTRADILPPSLRRRLSREERLRS